MILDSNNKRKPDVDYPCTWSYKVIGDDIDNMIAAIENITEGMNCDITPSNISENGKYYSLNVKVIVENEGERNFIFQQLDSHNNVKMVL